MSDLGISAGQPTEGQAPAAASTPAAQPASQGPGDGPWANALSQFDEGVRPQVDALLRQSVQPYLTRLEQDNATLRQQAQLFTDLQQSPAETYLSITSELFGDEAVDAVINLIAGEQGESGEPAAPTAATTPAETPVTPARDPEVEAMLNQWKTDQQRTAYDQEMARLTESVSQRIEAAKAAGQEPSDVPVNPKLMHTFVHIAGGDFEQAYEAYKQFYGDFRAEVGGTPPASDETPPPQAPPVLSATTGGSSTPPVEKHYDSLDDAIDAYFASQRAAPPVLGGV